MYVLFNRDMELSCDEAVIRLFGEKEKSSYAMTLLSMEEEKGGLTPLCNSFSKNAIEERITAIMKMKKRSLLTILTAALLITGVTVAFTSTAAPAGADITSQSGTEFTENEFSKLNALRPEGYEDMSVSKYQQFVWLTRDTEAYMNLLQRFSQNESFYEMRNTDDTASFYFNILEPLTAEKWQTRDFGGYTIREIPQTDQATLEYNLTLTILDADSLTVREYNDTRLNILEALGSFLQKSPEANLLDEQAMITAIDAELALLTKKWSSDSLSAGVEYRFTPATVYESEGTTPREAYVEPRMNPKGLYCKGTEINRKTQASTPFAAQMVECKRKKGAQTLTTYQNLIRGSSLCRQQPQRRNTQTSLCA